eukprot:COSAG02_NODE_4458_length_5338_cov_17.424699_4_plen_162_part_00
MSGHVGNDSTGVAILTAACVEGVLNLMNNKDDAQFPFIQYAPMTFAFGHRDSDMGEHLVDYSDGTPRVFTSGQSKKIASVYCRTDWDEELFRKTVDELVDLCPALKSILESQYYDDEFHEFKVNGRSKMFSQRDVFLAMVARCLYPTSIINGGLDDWRVIL